MLSYIKYAFGWRLHVSVVILMLLWSLANLLESLRSLNFTLSWESAFREIGLNYVGAFLLLSFWWVCDRE